MEIVGGRRQTSFMHPCKAFYAYFVQQHSVPSSLPSSYDGIKLLTSNHPVSIFPIFKPHHKWNLKNKTIQDLKFVQQETKAIIIK